MASNPYFYVPIHERIRKELDRRSALMANEITGKSGNLEPITYKKGDSYNEDTDRELYLKTNWMVGKTAWVRAFSFANIITDTDVIEEYVRNDKSKRNAKYAEFFNYDAVIQKYKHVLFNGSLNMTLEKGNDPLEPVTYNRFFSDNPEFIGGYNSEDEDDQSPEYGEKIRFRPSPGIESFRVTMKGSTSAIKEISIRFKVFTLKDYEIYSRLFMTLGCDVLFEWGWLLPDDSHYNYMVNLNELMEAETSFDEVKIQKFFDSMNHVEDRLNRQIVSGGNYEAQIAKLSYYKAEFDQSKACWNCTANYLTPSVIWGAVDRNNSALIHYISQEINSVSEMIIKGNKGSSSSPDSYVINNDTVEKINYNATLQPDAEVEIDKKFDEMGKKWLFKFKNKKISVEKLPNYRDRLNETGDQEVETKKDNKKTSNKVSIASNIYITLGFFEDYIIPRALDSFAKDYEKKIQDSLKISELSSTVEENFYRNALRYCKMGSYINTLIREEIKGSPDENSDVNPKYKRVPVLVSCPNTVISVKPKDILFPGMSNALRNILKEDEELKDLNSDKAVLNELKKGFYTQIESADYLQFYHEVDNRSVGNIRAILINISTLYKIFVEASTFVFALEKLCQTISDASGMMVNLSPANLGDRMGLISDSGQTIDAKGNVVDTIKISDLYKINNFGKNSIVTNLNLNIDITQRMHSELYLRNTLLESIDHIRNTVAYSSIDTTMGKIMMNMAKIEGDKNEGKIKGNKILKTEDVSKNKVKNFKKFITTHPSSIGTSLENEMQRIMRDIYHNFRLIYENHVHKLVLLNGSLTIDGISGIHNGCLFLLSYVPHELRNNVFIVTSVSHDIKNNRWETTLEFSLTTMKTALSQS